MTLNEAIVRVRYILKEKTEAFFKDVEITSWLNEGNRDFHNKKGVSDIWTITKTDSVTEIVLDSLMAKVNRLYYKSTSSANEELIDSKDYQLFRDRIIFAKKHSAGIFTYLNMH